MPFKRGDIVEYVPDGSIYVLDYKNSPGFWYVGTIVECDPCWAETHHSTSVDEGDMKLLRGHLS